jgi:hypothetical protein
MLGKHIGFVGIAIDIGAVEFIVNSAVQLNGHLENLQS